MRVFIPSLGRWNDQPTLTQLVRAGVKCELVVQEHEAGRYVAKWRDKAQVHALPRYVRTIAPTRQYILEHYTEGENFCMVDDDLTFYRRRDDDRTKLRDITPGELQQAFCSMDDLMEGPYAHVGMASREGANRNTDDYAKYTRIMRVLAYKTRVLLDRNISFMNMEVMEDFHVALSLLEAGYPNIVMNNYAHNQAGSNALGGCSTFRTPELHAAAAHKLKELHPDYVSVVQKSTKGAWGGGTRTDVNIQWKKAFHGSQT